MLKTANQYYAAAQNIDRDRALAELAQLPLRLNPTGKLYKAHIKKIKAKYNVKL